MTPIQMAEAMETRASIRRKATSRKSVQENANDRLADQLEQAAAMLREQQRTIDGDKRLITLLYEKERQQQNRIDVLEANYKIQLNINEKALQYIEQLERNQ
jgi:hypothetical protein